MIPDFLSVEDILEIHKMQLERFGGALGLRDRGLLESAIAQPQATFGGTFLHTDLFEMAATYLFHLVSNHPFVDGNKRVGLAAALVFLDLNGIVFRHGTNALYLLTMDVAQGQTATPQIATRLREIVEDYD
ncbi:MAG: type II toxin-antitoxin system death-on-curing family toxin [Deltaproteobacteria bacterium CG_4_9_14_3_um_filter_63_12]|nr:MAG: type II toxin-antitoxin system death-on-curing family toxin [Deltaproteobacteria bacterium CG_4_9_14_3_um_filter_63_12]